MQGDTIFSCPKSKLFEQFNSIYSTPPFLPQKVAIKTQHQRERKVYLNFKGADIKLFRLKNFIENGKSPLVQIFHHNKHRYLFMSFIYTNFIHTIYKTSRKMSQLVSGTQNGSFIHMGRDIEN